MSCQLVNYATRPFNFLRVSNAIQSLCQGDVNLRACLTFHNCAMNDEYKVMWTFVHALFIVKSFNYATRPFNFLRVSNAIQSLCQGDVDLRACLTFHNCAMMSTRWCGPSYMLYSLSFHSSLMPRLGYLRTCLKCAMSRPGYLRTCYSLSFHSSLMPRLITSVHA